MANEIKLTIRVDDNGDLKIVAKDAKKAAKGMDELAQSTERVSKSKSGLNVKQNRYNKMEKGAAQLTNNSTKAFSKMSQTLGGTLVPAYATLAANIFALTAAMGALRRAAAVEQLRAGLEAVGTTAGQNLPYLANQLKQITGYAISTKEAMSSVALGTSSGFSADQLKDLTKVAKGASLALGRDMEDAMSRLVRGTAKLEPEILDELGIMVRLDQAAADYAAQLGKTATQLTQFERRQAFLNATIEQGLKKFEFIADEVDPNPYDKLAASFDNLTKTGFSMINTVLEPLVTLLASSPAALLGILTIFGSTIVNKLVPGLQVLAEKQKDVAKASLLMARAEKEKQLKDIKKQGKEITGGFLPKQAQLAAKAMQEGTLTAQQYNQALLSIRRSETIRSGWLKTWKAQAKAASGEELTALNNKIAAGEIELKQMRAKEAQLVKLRKSQLSTTKVDIAKGTSKIATRESEYLRFMQNAGPIKGFAIAIKAATNNFKDLIKVSGALPKIAIGFRAAASTAKLFGIALLNALPVIGQIIFIAGLLYPIFQKIFGGGALAKKVDEVVESFENLVEVGERLNKTLESDASAAEKFLASLKVQVGITDRLIEGISGLKGVQKEEATKEIAQAVEARRDIRNIMEGASVGFFTRLKYAGADLKNLENEINSTIKNINEKAGKIDVDAASTVINEAIVRIEQMGGPASKALEGIKNSYDDVLNNIGDYKSYDGLIKKLEELDEKEKKVIASIGAARDANASFQKEIVKIGAKITTPVDDLVRSVSALTNEFKQSGLKGNLGYENFLEAAPEFKTALDTSAMTLAKFQAQLRNEEPPKTAAEALKYLEDANISYATVAEYTEGRFKAIQIELAKLQGTILKLKSTQGFLKGLTDINPQAAQKYHEVTKQILATRMSAIDAQNTEYLTEAQRIKLVEERKALEQEMLYTDIEATYGPLLTSVKLEQERLKLTQESIKATNERANIAVKALENEQKLIAAQENGIVSPEATLEIAKEAARVKKQAAEDEYDFTVKTAKLSSRQYILEMELAKAKAAASNLDTSIYDELISLATANYIVVAETALARKEEAKQAAAVAEAEAQRLFINEQLNRRHAILQTQAESLLAIDLKRQGSAIKLQIAREKLEKIEQDNAKATVGGEAAEERRLNLLKAQLEVFKALSDVTKAIYEDEKKFLELEHSLVSESLKYLDTQYKIVTAREKVIANVQNRQWNPEDELDSFTKYANLRKAQIDFEFKSAKELSQLEFDHRSVMIGLAIAEAKAKGNASGAAILLEEYQLILKRYNLEQRTLQGLKDLNKEEEKLKESELERAAINARLDERWKTRSFLMDALKEGSATIAALEVESLNLTEQKEVAEERLLDITKGGLTLTMAMNKLFEANLAIAKNRIAREKEILEVYRLEVDLAQEQYDTTLAIIKNQKIISNFLTGFGAALTPAEEYELQIQAAKQALEMQKLQGAIKLRELAIQHSITDLTILAAEASIKATKAKLEALKHEEGADVGAINKQITDLDTLSQTISSSRETALTQVTEQIRLETQILRLKEQQAEQAIIAAQMAGPGGILSTSVATKFGHDIATSIVNAMNSGASLYKNVSEAIMSNKVAPLEGQRDAVEQRLQIAIESGESETVVKALEDALKGVENNIKAIEESGLTFGETFKIGIAAITESMAPMIEQLKQLGPEGELAASVAEGALVITDSWISAAEGINTALASIQSGSITTFEGMMQAGVAVAQALSATISSMASIQQASSNAKIAAIDKEIEAEKRRDGQSAQSVAKLNALEKKKEAQKKKAFETNKKMMMAQTVMSTAAAIMNALTIQPFWVGIAMAAVAAAMGAAQLAIIAGTSYEGGGASGNNGVTSIAVGERNNTVDLATSRSPSGELAYMRGERGVGTTGANNYIPQGGAFTGRAVGGNTAFMVGEQGPELFVPTKPGNIIPADDTAKVGGQLNVNFSINTIDTQGMQDALLTQRGNIIGMIREAANSKGEFFLENINIREDDAL